MTGKTCPGLVHHWMWDRLAHPDVVEALPRAVRPTWMAMLAARSYPFILNGYLTLHRTRACSGALLAAVSQLRSLYEDSRHEERLRYYAANVAFYLADTIGDPTGFWDRADVAGVRRRLGLPSLPTATTALVEVAARRAKRSDARAPADLPGGAA
jgi:hypothetical protein